MKPAPEPPLPLLITGLAGVAGFNAWRYFKNRYPQQVIAVRRVDNWPLSGEGIIPLDLDDREALKKLFDRYRFRSVLNCEGTCKLKSCELDPEMATRVNIHTVESLLDVLEGQEVRLVSLSIDLVYSGTRGGDHVEEDETDPVTIYGKTMVDAERIILQRDPGACILRISLPMGPSFNGHAGAIDWIQSRFKKDKPATLYYDEVRTPTYSDCLNQVFQYVLGSDLSGLFHAGGVRKLSLYQIAQIVNRVGGYDPKHLMGCLRHQAGPIPPRAGDVTMNSEKLAVALGFRPFDPWPILDEMTPSGPDWHFERKGFIGSPKLLEETLYRNPHSPVFE